MSRPTALLLRFFHAIDSLVDKFSNFPDIRNAPGHDKIQLWLPFLRASFDLAGLFIDASYALYEAGPVKGQNGRPIKSPKSPFGSNASAVSTSISSPPPT